MAELAIEGQDLVVRLSPLEKLAAFRGDVRVPLQTVSVMTVDDHPWRSLRGIRAPGTGLPGVIAYGVRRHLSGRDFAALLFKREAVRIDLGHPSPFARLIVSVPDAKASIEMLKQAAEAAIASS